MQGKVVKILPSAYEVLTENLKYVLVPAKGKIKLKTKIVLGDNVEVDNGILQTVLPRENFLIRPECANINNFLIVLASNPKPNFCIVDLLVAICLKQGIKPAIVINKDDINEKGFVKLVKDNYGLLCDINVVSALNGTGTNELKQKLNGITALAGQSGVGKTTLINKIFGLNLKQGNLSDKTMRGMHTTTQSYFHVTKTGEIVVDTPGFSYLDFTKIGLKAEDLKLAYPDLNYVGCKYASCAHNGDDGCNVDNLIATGRINKERVLRYRKNYEKICNANKRKGR